MKRTSVEWQQLLWLGSTRPQGIITPDHLVLTLEEIAISEDEAITSRILMPVEWIDHLYLVGKLHLESIPEVIVELLGKALIHYNYLLISTNAAMKMLSWLEYPKRLETTSCACRETLVKFTKLSKIRINSYNTLKSKPCN